MEDDFYDEEYDYFDSTVEELKEQLKKEVKQDIQDKIKKLEEENKELKNVKENWETLKQEYEDKINEVEIEKQDILDNAKREIYNATLKDLFENCDYFKRLYTVDYEMEKREKCDKCDEDRKLTLIDCYGREYKVNCKCSESKRMYYAKENSETAVYIQKSKGKDNFMFNFRNTASYDYGQKIDKKDVLEKFDKDRAKNYWNTYFTTLEEAQKYADYLNSKED